MVADVDGPTWASDHARGLRPDASPYGLHRLGTITATRPARGALARRAERAVRHRGGGWEWAAEGRNRLPPGTDLRVCWDERTGVPALTRPYGPPVATGVIWLTDSTLSRPLRAVARRALRRATAVWALSTAQLPVLRDDWGVPERSLHWVPFGIDAEFWSPEASESCPSPPLVLGVGNDRHRDHDLLVRAVTGLRAGLEIVTALPVRVPSSVGMRVSALDHVSLRARYSAASVVAILMRPNLHVSGVTTLLEAQAMGRPVVVTETPGIRDYLSPDSAVLVPPGDAGAARKAVSDLLADPDRAAAMGVAGRAFVEGTRTSAVMASAVQSVLRGTSEPVRATRPPRARR